MTRSRWVALAAAAAVVAVLIGSVIVFDPFGQDDHGDVPVVAGEPDTGCGEPSWRPTFFPDGFEPDLRPGSGGQVVVDATGDFTPDSDQPPWHHYRGPIGRYIDVIRGRAAIAPIGPTVGEPEPVAVLGTPGQVGWIHEGFGVRFDLGAGDCDVYLLAAYGVDKGDLVAFAAGLRSTSD